MSIILFTSWKKTLEESSKSFRCFFVLGATASGKSQVALDWAMALNQNNRPAMILGCDSVQIYEGLSVGAAMPSEDEREQIRHELYDCIKPLHEMTAGEYRSLALAQIQKEKDQGTEVVFLTGGTGFYFQALEKGMADAIPVSQELSLQIRTEVESEEGRIRLYEELRQRDPALIEKIHINDSYRLCRAIEVIRTTGRPWSEILTSQVQQSFPEKLTKVGIAWTPDELKNRIRMRTQKMFLNDALILEVQELLKKDLLNWAPLASVGYRETIEFLNGQIKTKADLIERIEITTWQLAKRQLTWFKRDKSIHWLDMNAALLMSRDLAFLKLK